MHLKKRYTWLKLILAILSLSIGAGIAHHYLAARDTALAISDYRESRDRAEIHEIFRKDWYWLSNRDYNPANIDFVLKTHSPNEYEPRYFGKMKIEVLREHNHVAGFITYYMLNFYEGKILFLAIEQGSRGKRYGEKLLDFAVKDLRKQGAQVARLVTRTDNISAQKLYKRFGFTETVADDGEGFVHFEIKT